MSATQGDAAKRGIYLVANQRSSELCHNLLYSIRECGCKLPIRVIPYGGEPLTLAGDFGDVRLVRLEDFSAEGHAFVGELMGRMPKCAPGLLYRYFAWFGEFDEFIYSDNDVVAVMNWERLFPFLDGYELVHADQQYVNGARYNFVQPTRFEELLGPGALDWAVNAGHLVCRPQSHHLTDLLAALSWMEAHPEVPKWHDQALLCTALAMAKWPKLNLCREPHGWGNSSASHYKNMFDVLKTVQTGHPVSHIHYAGYSPTGTKSIDDLTFASLSAAERNSKVLWALARESSGVTEAQRLMKRARQKVKHRLRR